jgi:hypothetical protein
MLMMVKRDILLGGLLAFLLAAALRPVPTS